MQQQGTGLQGFPTAQMAPGMGGYGYGYNVPYGGYGGMPNAPFYHPQMHPAAAYGGYQPYGAQPAVGGGAFQQGAGYGAPQQHAAKYGAGAYGAFLSTQVAEALRKGLG